MIKYIAIFLSILLISFPISNIREKRLPHALDIALQEAGAVCSQSYIFMSGNSRFNVSCGGRFFEYFIIGNHWFIKDMENGNTFIVKKVNK